MADLAPFVAAILRDGVVDDLQADNRRLRADGPTTTVLVAGPGGTIYATGARSQRECLREVIANVRDPDADRDDISFDMEEVEGAATCRLGLVRDCRVLIKKEEGLGPDVVCSIGALARSMRVDDGRLQIAFHPAEYSTFTLGSTNLKLQLDIPVPSEVLSNEEVVEGRWMFIPPGFLAANADAPVQFQRVMLDEDSFFETLAGGGES